jgi:hypothetical protein
MFKPLLLGFGVLAGLLLAPLAGDPQDEKKKDEKQELKERTQKHKKDVVELRGLEFKADVTVGIYSKKELQEFLKSEFDKDLPPDKAEKYQRAYAKFGLIPSNLNLYKAYLELFSSSIAGFYHPKTKELRLVRPGEDEDAEGKAMKALGFDMEAVTLVHELTHAAQDQNFELSTLPLEDETNDDLVLALKSVIEGDASAIGWKYGFGDRFDAVIGAIDQQYKTGALPGEAGKLPAYLRQSLTFPYGYGTDFIVKYLKGIEGDLKDTSRLFKDLPLSSEQILHPEKYFDKDKRDNPILVTMPDLVKLFGAPWTETLNNVHGEFGIEVLLKEFRSDKLRPVAIKRAKEGWGGDRYVVLEDDKQNTMYVWYTTWDTEKDAKEFYDAYCLALEKKYDVDSPEGERGAKTTYKTKGGQVLIELRDKDVLVLDGATEDMLGKTAAIWKGTKKAEIIGFERLKKFVCPKDGTKDAFSGNCPRCGTPLQYKDEEEKNRTHIEKKRKKDF